MMQSKVIDADGHILEPPDLWARYLENKYKERAIRMEKDQDGVEYFVIDGRPSANLRGIGPARSRPLNVIRGWFSTSKKSALRR